MFLVWENVTIALIIIADSFGIDLYEVGVLVGACFLVNYVTADAKTNWAEGYILVAFYIMIVSPDQVSDVLCLELTHGFQAVSAWFYIGQPELEIMLFCPGTVAEGIAAGVAAEGGAGER